MNDRTDRLDTRGIRPPPRTMSDVVEGQPLLLSSRRQVDDFMSTAPGGEQSTAREGEQMDVRAQRRALARKHGAEVTSPATIGYHLRTVAAAARKQFHRGVPDSGITASWRVLDAETPAAKRFGAEFVAERRRRQGLQD